MRALMPLAVLVALLMSLPLLGTVVTGSGWWAAAAAMMTAAAAASALYRLSGRSSLAVPFLQLLAAGAVATPLFAAHTGWLGLVPTGETVSALYLLLDQGIDDIDFSPPPVTASTGVMFITALAFTALTVAADFLAVTARCPGLVGGPVLAILAIPLTVDDTGVGAGAAVSAATGFLLLLAADMWLRGRQWGTRVPDGSGPSVRLLNALRRAAVVTVSIAVAAAASLVVPLSIPFLGSGFLYLMAEGVSQGPRGPEVITTTNPMSSLERNVLSLSDDPVLTYSTDAEKPEYLRTHVLDEFDGVNWTMSPVDAEEERRVRGALPLPTDWRSGTGGDTVSTRISLDPDTPPMDFLPVPYWPRALEAPGEWYTAPETLAVFTTESGSTGLNYTVVSATDEPSAAELAATGPARSAPQHYLSLPEALDPRVADLAEDVTEGADSPHAQAIALQEFFTGDSFTYTLEPSPVPGGRDLLTHFLLEDRTGYCQHFAGAMAALARHLGIPARLATGFTPGERSEEGHWTVTRADAHAWPELYFEGMGWIRFEPTPSSPDAQGTATVPDYTSDDPPERDPAEETERPEASETGTDRESAPSADESGGAAGDGATASPSAAFGQDTDRGVPSWLPAVGAALAAVLLLSCLPALVRALLRGSRAAALSSGPPTAATHAAWRELCATSTDLGIPWDPAESPRATAARLTATTDPPAPARDALLRLALAEEAARYAPAPAPVHGVGADLRTACAALAAVSSRWDRARALLLPRSLAPWRRGTPRPAPSPA
ncbi:transglutaminaseTgpA domain-containing protein [Nocardiopsis sp. CNT312]|uniref:transglutaminase family protein n=1 Tax=Nocardiopsis sp. CNT312 TaxID=1137268 RepID=UPI00350E9420